MLGGNLGLGLGLGSSLGSEPRDDNERRLTLSEINIDVKPQYIVEKMKLVQYVVK